MGMQREMTHPKEPEQKTAQPETPPGLVRRQPLSLQDLLDSMSQGFEGVGRQIHSMQTQIDKKFRKVENEQRETQQMAAKALTATEAINRKVTTMESRITALELKTHA